MSEQRFEFKVVGLVPAAYTITADELIYKQGIRTQRVSLTEVQAFAVRALPAAPMSKPLAELLLDVGAPGGPRRRKKFMLDVGEPACAAMLVALGARLPHADLTALPWPEAAARLGVATRVPWYSDWKIIGGVVLMGASAVVLALPTRPRGGSELAGYMAGGAVVALGGLALLIVGLVQRRRGR